MKRSFMQTALTLLLVVTCALAPNAVVAQQSEPEQTAEASDGSVYDAYFMSDEHRQEIYEQNRKSPGKAILWTALFPGLGNIYAEQYLLAGVSIIFMVFAATFVGFGLTTRQPRIVGLGGITAGIAYGGGGLASVIGVAQYNKELRRGLKVDGGDIQPHPYATLITLRF